MKKVVGGRVYDTEKCVDVVKWEERDSVQGIEILVRRELHRVPTPAPGKSPVDCFETSSYGSCYLKNDNLDLRSGDFFLETTIADICHTYSTCGCRISPVDDQTARQLVERYGDYETYCRYFGRPEGVAIDPKEVEKACEPVTSAKWKAEEERDKAKSRLADVEGEKASLADAYAKLEARVRELAGQLEKGRPAPDQAPDDPF